jgi:hypothetical protein
MTILQRNHARKSKKTRILFTKYRWGYLAQYEPFPRQEAHPESFCESSMGIDELHKVSRTGEYQELTDSRDAVPVEPTRQLAMPAKRAPTC